MGVYVYMVWFSVVFASFVVAGIHLGRRRLKGLVFAFAAVIGSLLTWAFVSAWIGVLEIDGYEGSMAFMISIAVGAAGVAFLVLSCLGLRRPAIQADASWKGKQH